MRGRRKAGRKRADSDEDEELDLADDDDEEDMLDEEDQDDYEEDAAPTRKKAAGASPGRRRIKTQDLTAAGQLCARVNERLKGLSQKVCAALQRQLPVGATRNIFEIQFVLHTGIDGLNYLLVYLF